MSSYQCCDCGEIKASKSDLEAHLNSDHIGWTPYQCFYCSQDGISTRKPSKEMLREHVTLRHPSQEFTFLCTDDHINNERLQDMLHRSTVDDQSPNSTHNTHISVSATIEGNVSPLVTSLTSPSPHPQIKEEDLDVEEFLGHPPIITINGDVKSVAEINSDDIKPNMNILGNSKCETCQESVPRNLPLIRDHVKLHFKEKTGCVPDDLTNLLPKLQFVYCQLLMNSFPFVGASILFDDGPDCNKETNQQESDKIGLTEFHNVKEQHGQFSHAKEDPKSSMTQVSQTTTVERHHPIGKVSGKEVSCHVCGQKFVSMYAMLHHRTRKHGIVAKWHCKQCNIDISQVGGDSGCSAHLLHVHVGKRTYECSKCGKSVKPSMMKVHDKRYHGGKGRCQLFNNLHRYKLQVEALREKLIIDLNALSSSKKKLATSRKHRKKLDRCRAVGLSSLLAYERPVKLNCQFGNEMSMYDSTNGPKSAPKKAKETNPALFCDTCDEMFSSKIGMRIHRSSKHGIMVKWKCKQCNIYLGIHDINSHLLIVHLGKQRYVCSLCGKSVSSLIGVHDISRHDGLGKARSIKNLILYQKEIKEFRDKFIIDVNSTAKVGTPETNSAISQSRSFPKLIAKAKPRKLNSALSCEICNVTVPSLSGLKSHRYMKHGILVKRFCKKCNINLQRGQVNIHLLTVHIGKKTLYECSLCKRAIRPYTRLQHDRQYHGGYGKTHIVNNMSLYRSKVEELHNKFIIDINSSSSSNLQKKYPTNSVISCIICNATVPSLSGLKTHRYIKHGISVKWYCKGCKINLESSSVNVHLLVVHVGKKKLYECSLCETTVLPSSINLHDRQSHGGVGKAHLVYNMHHYKAEVDALHKKLIIDLNSSSSSNSEKKFVGNYKPKISTKSKSLLRHIKQKPKISQKWSSLYIARQRANKFLSEGSTKSEKLVETTQTHKSNSDVTCERCDQTVPSANGLPVHRYHKHGISIKWYCLQCNINLAPNMVNRHLLSVHIGIKKLYECSLCGTTVAPGTIGHHDRQFHGGLGEAQTLNNKQRFKLEVEALRKELIIDLNASFVKLDANMELETKMVPGVPHIPGLQEMVVEALPSAEDSRNSVKLEENKPKRTGPIQSCEICSETYSATGIRIHRARIHGIFVKWHCKQCNINLGKKFIDKHLLNIHIGKQVYMCSLCDASVIRSQIELHDKKWHNGLGKARVIYNVQQYAKELQELRDSLIIDMNMQDSDLNSAENISNSESMIIESNPIVTAENSPEESSTPQSKSSQIIDFNAMVKAQHSAEKNSESKIIDSIPIVAAGNSPEESLTSQSKTNEIIDFNAMVKDQNSAEKNVNYQSKCIQVKSMTKLQSKLRLHEASDNRKWLSRFKRSQKRKRKQMKRLTFK